MLWAKQWISPAMYTLENADCFSQLTLGERRCVILSNIACFAATGERGCLI